MATSQGIPKIQGEVDASQTEIAKRLGKELIDCDPSILSLIVVDNLGRVLHVSRSARLAESEHVSLELIQALGTLAQIIIGAASKAAQVMGATEAIIGVFKNQKVLLVNVHEYNLLLALRLSRPANAEKVCDKIGDLLASHAEP